MQNKHKLRREPPVESRPGLPGAQMIPTAMITACKGQTPNMSTHESERQKAKKKGGVLLETTRANKEERRRGSLLEVFQLRNTQAACLFALPETEYDVDDQTEASFFQVWKEGSGIMQKVFGFALHPNLNTGSGHFVLKSPVLQILILQPRRRIRPNISLSKKSMSERSLNQSLLDPMEGGPS